MSETKITNCHNDPFKSGGEQETQTRKQDFGQGRIPDILECLANLSNDEVFTPPSVASAMLDLLPEHVWSDPNLKWLDIGCKTGVFLREAAKRLMVGLEDAFPSERDRVDHILGEMLYGIATSHLTGLIARRTLYSATEANSAGSSARYINDFGVDGNIRFQDAKHNYGEEEESSSCLVCGANNSIDRTGKDNYAYELIHTDKPQELFTDKKGNPVKFDVVIGNPPYHMADSSDSPSAKPLYNKFVEVAKELNPQYMTLIIPARWFAGGKGLDKFRATMIADRRMKAIHDFPSPSEVFPDNAIMGGVMYFLWSADHKGDCNWDSTQDGVQAESRVLDLRAAGDVILRSAVGYSVLKKVKEVHGDGKWMDSEVSKQKPFGLRTFVKGHKKKASGDVVLYQNGGTAFYAKDKLTKNVAWVDLHKALTPRTGDPRTSPPASISGKPFAADKGSACTETYLVAGLFDTKPEADRRVAYMKTKFFRFMMSLRKVSQDAAANVYAFVPVMDNDVEWTDAALYEHFGLSQEEIDHIEATIKGMP